jgi:hypothetical protein
VGAARFNRAMNDPEKPRRLALIVPQPCDVPWSSMAGDDAARHCARCDRTIYDAERLGRGALEEGSAPHAAHLCVRMRVDSAGRGVVRRPRPVASAALLLTGVLAACGSREPAQPRPTPAQVLPADAGARTVAPTVVAPMSEAPAPGSAVHEPQQPAPRRPLDFVVGKPARPKRLDRVVGTVHRPDDLEEPR